MRNKKECACAIIDALQPDLVKFFSLPAAAFFSSLPTMTFYKGEYSIEAQNEYRGLLYKYVGDALIEVTFLTERLIEAGMTTALVFHQEKLEKAGVTVDELRTHGFIQGGSAVELLDLSAVLEAKVLDEPISPEQDFLKIFMGNDPALN
ncbi:MAG: hypothetical protein SFW62_06275 [Alphaproteobacteria bacterium]|nr:hypothetical protein [Alphaproteobacteria bacterium]